MEDVYAELEFLCYLWLVIEFIWWIYAQFRGKYFDQMPVRPVEPFLPADRQRFMDHLISIMDAKSLRSFVSAWFRSAPFEAVYRDNMLQWCAAHFFYRPINALTSEVC